MRHEKVHKQYKRIHPNKENVLGRPPHVVIQPTVLVNDKTTHANTTNHSKEETLGKYFNLQFKKLRY